MSSGKANRAGCGPSVVSLGELVLLSSLPLPLHSALGSPLPHFSTCSFCWSSLPPSLWACASFSLVLLLVVYPIQQATLCEMLKVCGQLSQSGSTFFTRKQNRKWHPSFRHPGVNRPLGSEVVILGPCGLEQGGTNESGTAVTSVTTAESSLKVRSSSVPPSL